MPAYRRIQPADAPALLAIRTSTDENATSAEDLQALGINATTLRQVLLGTHGGWLAEDPASGILGFAIGDRSSGELWLLAVLPAHAGQGIGGELLRLTEEWLWSEGCSRLWLATHADRRRRAYRLYLSRGWSDDGVHDGALRMSRKRPPAHG